MASKGESLPALEESDIEDVATTSRNSSKVTRKRKPGIVHLSHIPPGFNVSQTTMFFSQFGRLGRIYLKPDEKEKALSKDNFAKNFTEGWVEFLSKRVAKEVAQNLNNTLVGGKKRHKAHGTLWNIKYLPHYKWVNLTEQMALEKALYQSKMRTETAKARRVADHFKTNVERSKRIEKQAKKRKVDST